MRALWLLTLCATVATAKPARRVRPGEPAAQGPRATGRVRAATSSGQVKYLSTTLAYLDRGRNDGLTIGRTLTFTRAGRQVGTCVVENVADHYATCLNPGLREGDRFGVARAPASAPLPPEAPADDAVLAIRRTIVVAQTQPLVDFDVASSGASNHRASVTLSESVFANFTSATKAFDVRRLDAAIYDVEIWKGLRASADVTLLSYADRVTPYRARIAAPVVLQVRQLELGFRRSDVPFQAALGRVWLRNAPGLLVLDGAQVSYRINDTFEVGAYGGLLPDPSTLAVLPTQGGAGAFATARSISGQGDTATVLQGDVRVGFSSRAGVGGRFEAAFAGHLFKGRTLDAHVTTELSYGHALQAVAGLDALRADVGWRPLEKLRFVVGGRYRGGTPTGVVELGVVSPGQRAVHGDFGGVYDVTPWLTAGLTAGVAADFDSALTQVRFGPELVFPTVLGRNGSVSVGYAEEIGWLRGRSAYGQVTVRAASWLRLVSRTTWFQQAERDAAINDLGESVSVDVRPLTWLWGRASLSGRTALDAEVGLSRTAGLFSVQLGGQF